MNQGKQIKLGAIISYLAIIINILAGFIYTPWMVQQIGQSEYGIYTLANSLISLFLVDFGLSAATSRYLSKYRAEKTQKKAANFLGAVYKLYLLITAVIFVLLTTVYFFIDMIYTQLTPVEVQQFKLVYIIAASFSVFSFPFTTFDGILIAYEKFVELKLADILYRISFVVSTIIALIMGQGLYALVTLHAIVGLIVVLYKFIVIKKKISIEINFNYSEKSMYKEVFSFSFWVTISSLAQRLVFNITPSILGIVANSAEIASFGIVATIESYVYTVITAINGLFMPRVSKIIAENDKELNPLLLKVGKYLYALNGLIVAGFAVVGRSFITVWVGAEYFKVYWGVLLVIIPGMFYNSLQIANTTMIAMKRVNIQAYVNITTGLINLALSFPLSMRFGAVGACSSIFIAYIVRGIVLNIIYHRALPFNMLQFAKKCYFKMSLPAVATILIGIGVNYLASGSGWKDVFLKGAMTVSLYIIFAYNLGLSKDEKLAIHRIIRNNRLVKKFTNI